MPQAVYFITPGKKVIRVADDVRRPNGITLSPDGKTLYVNDWDADSLVSYSVQADGTLKNRKNFAKYDLKQETDHGLVSGADGLCIDNAGHTFATTPAGVQVFDAKGKHLGNIEAPYDMPPQNCGFGGPGGSYFYCHRTRRRLSDPHAQRGRKESRQVIAVARARPRIHLRPPSSTPRQNAGVGSSVHSLVSEDTAFDARRTAPVKPPPRFVDCR